MAKKQETTKDPSKIVYAKSIIARTIDWANENVPGPAANNMARFIGKFNYNAEKSEISKKRDACSKHKKVSKIVTGAWYDDPSIMDVKDIDIPTTTVEEHTRINPKTGALITVRMHHRVTNKFPKGCKNGKN
jgi:hypothetical protein